MPTQPDPGFDFAEDIYAAPDEGPDDPRHLPPETPVPAAPAPPSPPPTAIDWSRTRLTAAFVRALAAAQGAAQTVDKASEVPDTPGRKGHAYAGADAMIAEATRVLSSNGIAWVCASRPIAPPDIDRQQLGDQWACSEIVTESLLLHADDVEGVAVLALTGRTISIGRKGTLIDKADKAGETYLRGYIARDICGLDRGHTDDDVGQRDDSNAAMGGRKPSARLSSADKDAVDQVFAALLGARKVAGLKGPGGVTLAPSAILADLMGPAFKIATSEDAAAFVTAGRAEIERIRLSMAADDVP